MPTTSTSLHWQTPDSTILWLCLAPMGLGQVALCALDAAQNGGFFFLLPLGLFTVLLTLPLRLAELALGRRAQKGLVEGMATLTREADAHRLFRLWSWFSLVALALAFGLSSLNTAWSLSFLLHLATTTQPHLLDFSLVALRWQLLPGLLVALTIGTILAERRWAGLRNVVRTTAGLALLCLLLLLISGAHWPLDNPHRLTEGTTWTLALRDALLLGAGGFGVWYSAGACTPRSSSLLTPALYALPLTLLAIGSLMPVFNPTLPLTVTSPAQTLLLSIPRSLSYGSVMTNLCWHGFCAITGLMAMIACLEPLQQVLLDKHCSARKSLFFALVAGLVGISLFLIPFTGQLLNVIIILLAMLLSVFCGWAMKISHLRKTLQLPDEWRYNLWRIAVRIAIPIAALTLLAHFRLLL